MVTPDTPTEDMDLVAILQADALHVPAGETLLSAHGAHAEIAGTHAGILLPHDPFATSRRRPGRHAVAALVVRQRLLEALLELGDVLPARHPVTLPPAETRRLLTGNFAALERAFAGIAGSVQYQVTISWDPVAALARRRGGEPGLARRAGEGRLAFGRRAARSAEVLRAALAAEIASEIDAVCDDTLELPREDDGVLLNLVARLARGGIDALEARLEAVDGASVDPLRIRLVGPLPPVSFAAFTIDRPDAARLAAARRALALGPGDRSGDPARAFRASVLEMARRTLGRDPRDLDALRAARDLLLRVGEVEAALTAAGWPRIGDAPPLLGLSRDPGQAGSAGRRSAA